MEDLQNINSDEQTLQDLRDRAWACDPTSDDYLELNDKIIRMQQAINEKRKIENQREIELEKIKLEREKMEQDRNWLNPKFLIPIVVPAAVGIGDTLYRAWFTANMLRDVADLEKDVIVSTTTPGKWVLRAVTDFFTSKKRG